MTHNTQLLDAAMDVAMQCIATGETLLPFVITEGGRGAIVSIDAGKAAEQLELAQRAVDDLPADASAWAFAYDGYLTLAEEKTDAIFIEVGSRAQTTVSVYAQRYSPAGAGRKVKKIGVLSRISNMKPRLDNVRFSEGQMPNHPTEPLSPSLGGSS
jgi:hypothetical protein